MKHKEKIETYFPVNSNNRTFEYMFVDDLENWLRREIDLRNKKKRTDVACGELGILMQLKFDIGRGKDEHLGSKTET